MWNSEKASNYYNIPHWGNGYFGLTEQGTVYVKPLKHGLSIDLFRLSRQIEAEGLRFPVLVRFNDILTDRVHTLQTAFSNAMQACNYRNAYTAIYPIKVNQQRLVVETLVKAGSDQFGLESGSKSELLAVLGLASRGSIIICNGYKDTEYVRLALIARKMGFQVYIIVEKCSELDCILTQAKVLGIEPFIGLRIRLASLGTGKWQNTGGEKSKFGLTSAQILEAVNRLKNIGKLHWFQLLHFHLGSQIANIRDIQTGLKEAARFYVELHHLGCAITQVDVGGGLGIDYEGTCSRSECSINYTIEEYAKNTVFAFSDACKAAALPEPHLMSESGRALTAHHAVLLTRVVETEIIEDTVASIHLGTKSPVVLHELMSAYQTVSCHSVLEAYHDLTYYFAEAQSLYLHGLLTLSERAQAEQLYQATCLKIRSLLNPMVKSHRKLWDSLNERLADKLFTNLSVFQSLPDVWAIEQIFPVLPLTGLDRPPEHRAIIQDITCDSDGRIDYYVDGQGVEATLPMPIQPNNSLLGFFLVGAYQDILGDIHNLFGRTDSVHVQVNATTKDYQLLHPTQGDTVETVLQQVNISADALFQAYQQYDLSSDCLSELQAGLLGYTYLEKDIEKT